MKPISILLGAGFSATMGYPVGNELNNQLMNFRRLNMSMSPDGKLFGPHNGESDVLYWNPYVVYLQCCIKLIEEYSHDNRFDYEEFFEIISDRKSLANSKYLELLQSFTTDIISIDSIMSNIEDVYNQMVAHLLKDRDNKTWYDNLPHHIGPIEEYDGFLTLLKNWSADRIINVHTLNHDLLFESFNRTDYLSGCICDGFEELGSEYYGELHDKNGRIYHVRLEKFTGRYSKCIHLYKMHGSLDYVLYYRTLTDGVTQIPHQYVKTRYGVGYDGLMRDVGDISGYERYPFAYHANFLTGTTSKIKKYDDPLLFRHLFNSFEQNLEDSEILIIIGYGCKDFGINDMIAHHFRGKKIFIVDPYYKGNETIVTFAKRVSASILDKHISDLKIEDFTI